ncbi:MAG: hypothetical protein EAZ57_08790 [Cytophagales bacterium]|nr:MAG: hypothetical protein EAZ67_09600 [Cytophagales bacterium]TAF60122.1 MAG: hypothetical protein EAZ57_08790 [Cytophagales bacterium]
MYFFSMNILGGHLIEEYNQLKVVNELATNVVLNSIPDILFLMNTEGQYLYYKKGEGRTFIEENKIIGSYIQESGMPEEIISKILSINAIALESGTPQKIAYHLDFPNDKRRFYESIAVRYNSYMVLRIVRDITARIVAEKELIQIKNEEEKKRCLLNYVVSHQIRSRIATILGIGVLLREHMLSQKEEELFMEQVFMQMQELDTHILTLSGLLNS